MGSSSSLAETIASRIWGSYLTLAEAFRYPGFHGFQWLGCRDAWWLRVALMFWLSGRSLAAIGFLIIAGLCGTVHLPMHMCKGRVHGFSRCRSVAMGYSARLTHSVNCTPLPSAGCSRTDRRPSDERDLLLDGEPLLGWAQDNHEGPRPLKGLPFACKLVCRFQHRDMTSGSLFTPAWAARQYWVASPSPAGSFGVGFLVPLDMGRQDAGDFRVALAFVTPLSLEGGGLLFISGRTVRSWVALFDLASMRSCPMGFYSPSARTPL